VWVVVQKKTDLKLLRLVRGEGGVFWPTRQERRLLKFALDRFGEMISQFLLTGYGKEKVARRWSLGITFIGEDRTLQKRQLKIITHEPADGSSCLPRKRDPLVFLALLRLLLNKGQVSVTKADLLYSVDDVLSLLGWDDTGETRQEIDEAIQRYFQLMFMWELNRPELSRRKLSFSTYSERPVGEFRTIDRAEEEDGVVKRVYNQVKFNEFFINGLLSRNLFGLNWNKVRTLKLGKGLPTLRRVHGEEQS
jgi:hypothetical protein